MGPGALPESLSHSDNCRWLNEAHAIVIAKHVNVISFYTQLNVSSTDIPVTKPQNSHNRSDTAPQVCDRERSE